MAGPLHFCSLPTHPPTYLSIGRSIDRSIFVMSSLYNIEIETYNISNDITELDGAIDNTGKGTNLDGLPGRILQLAPPNLRECIIKLFGNIFKNTYPSQWRNQLLFPIE